MIKVSHAALLIVIPKCHFVTDSANGILLFLMWNKLRRENLFGCKRYWGTTFQEPARLTRHLTLLHNFVQSSMGLFPIFQKSKRLQMSPRANRFSSKQPVWNDGKFIALFTAWLDYKIDQFSINISDRASFALGENAAASGNSEFLHTSKNEDGDEVFKNA